MTGTRLLRYSLILPAYTTNEMEQIVSKRPQIKFRRPGNHPMESIQICRTRRKFEGFWEDYLLIAARMVTWHSDYVTATGMRRCTKGIAWRFTVSSLWRNEGRQSLLYFIGRLKEDSRFCMYGTNMCWCLMTCEVFCCMVMGVFKCLAEHFANTEGLNTVRVTLFYVNSAYWNDESSFVIFMFPPYILW